MCSLYLKFKTPGRIPCSFSTCKEGRISDPSLHTPSDALKVPWKDPRYFLVYLVYQILLMPGVRKKRLNWTRSCMVEVTMEALTMALRLWTGIEKVYFFLLHFFWCGFGLPLNSYHFRAPCAQTNPTSKSSWPQSSFCQGCSSPTCCEETQKAKQCKQKMRCGQTLQRQRVNCLCAWYWSQPTGGAG